MHELDAVIAHIDAILDGKKYLPIPDIERREIPIHRKALLMLETLRAPGKSTKRIRRQKKALVNLITGKAR